MQTGARRLLSRFLRRCARRGRLTVCVMLVLLASDAALAQGIDSARYVEPTQRYAHGVLGDAIEHGALELTVDGQRRILRLPDERVFEDTAPRLADVDGDGAPEVVTVESHRDLGARLAIYGPQGMIAATPYIGTRFRWLAPVAVADLEGDGQVELAYVDRPHLAKTLRVWRFVEGALHEVATFRGVTNHRIGERDIAGGLRRCGEGPEMIVADADWQRLLAVRFDGESLSARDIGPHEGRDSFARALSCR